MSDLDRRQLAGALAALTFVGGLPAQADDPPKPPREGDALLDLVLARCGKHLDDADRKALRERLRFTGSGALARALKLDWRDEPAFTYSPDAG